MADETRTTIERLRQVNTYSEMWHTSSFLLTAGQANPAGSAHQFRASLVFTAFTLEAFLNHIGPDLYECWRDLEFLSPRSKLNLVCEHVGVQADYSRRPWQTIKLLFDFRNLVAHGRSTKETATFIVPTSIADTLCLIATKWEAFGTKENAIRAREDVESIIRILCATEDLSIETPFSLGFQSECHSAIPQPPS